MCNWFIELANSCAYCSVYWSPVGNFIWTENTQAIINIWTFVYSCILVFATSMNYLNKTLSNERYYLTYPYWLQEVQVGQEVALCVVQPFSRWLTDDVLRQLRHVLIGNGHEFLQRRGIAQVSKMNSEPFNKHL